MRAMKVIEHLGSFEVRYDNSPFSPAANIVQRGSQEPPKAADAARRHYPPVLPKYRNPSRPSETWAGRGKRPQWLTVQLESGKQINDFRIDLAA